MTLQKGKYIILLGDGMADEAIAELQGKTPLEAAHTPHMDSVASQGITGMVQTVPKGMAPGSDTANLSVFGYDPKIYYTGRAPLEAVNMNIPMTSKDVAFRCNIVTYKDQCMHDFSGHHIETEFAKIIIDEVNKNLKGDFLQLYPGISYRHILLWKDYPFDEITYGTPPHDIHDKPLKDFLPTGKGKDIINDFMLKSQEIIENSAIIKGASSHYQGDPSAFWIWGGGYAPTLDPMSTKYGLDGFTISAVDLIHGIGKAAGISSLSVDGATGWIDTNYEGKVEALLKNIDSCNFTYLHVESPDEAGHAGNLEYKIQAIEDFDKRIVGPVLEGMKKYEEYTILVMPDHPTPLSTRTHTDEAVPFALISNTERFDKRFAAESYNEISSSKTGLFIEEGHNMINLMIHGNRE